MCYESFWLEKGNSYYSCESCIWMDMDTELKKYKTKNCPKWIAYPWNRFSCISFIHRKKYTNTKKITPKVFYGLCYGCSSHNHPHKTTFIIFTRCCGKWLIKNKIFFTITYWSSPTMWWKYLSHFFHI